MNQTLLYVDTPSTLCSPPLDADSASLFDIETLPDVPELKRMLTGYGIEFSQWGTRCSKTIESLHKEMRIGIMDLKWYKSNLCRVVMVARIHVIDEANRNELVETYQIFNADGRKRIRHNHNHLNKKVMFRWRLIPQYNETFEFESYKHYSPEPVPCAASRALMDELAIPKEVALGGEIHYVPNGISQIDSPSSMSYPGLPTVYFLCHYQVALPEEYFPHQFEHRSEEMTTYFESRPMK
jgi:hypothetical protein